jgi:hypothetical protein
MKARLDERINAFTDTLFPEVSRGTHPSSGSPGGSAHVCVCVLTPSPPIPPHVSSRMCIQDRAIFNMRKDVWLTQPHVTLRGHELDVYERFAQVRLVPSCLRTPCISA